MIMKKILSCLVTFLTANAFAQTDTFDIVTFRAPQLWKRDANEQVISFSNSKGTIFSVVGLYKSRPINAIIESEFITEWNDLVNQALGVNVTPVVKRSQQNGCTVFSATANVSTSKNGTYNVQLSSYATNGKIISAMIYSNGDLYKKETNAFLSSVTLLNKGVVTNSKTSVSGSAEIKPGANTNKNAKTDNNGISGVWVGFETGKYVFGVTSYDYVNNRNNYGSTYKATALAIKWRVFWSDGKYYDGVPFGGLINYNRNDPKNDYAGSYTMGKNIATAKMDHYSSAQRMYVFYPPAKLKFLDKYEYVKCQSVDGLRLNGTYMSADPISTAYYNSINKPIATISLSLIHI